MRVASSSLLILLLLQQSSHLLTSSFQIPSSVSSFQTIQKRSFLLASTSSAAKENTVLPDTSKPLSPQTFAGQIERMLLSKFNPSDIERVVTSWRLLDQDYEHYEFVGPQQNPPVADNPELSKCHQHAPSYVPGLTARTFWDVDSFPWCEKLRDSYNVIKKEFKSVTADAETLAQKGNNVWSGALTEEASGYGEGWKTLVLLDKGTWDVDNVKLFPKTAKAVYESGVPATEVFFASMKPNTDIKPHSDFTNFVLTSHLALDIPYSGQNKCRLSVGDDTRQWINGEVMLFDTSIMHDAVNESDEMRYILMMRLWHPDLTEVEKEALQFLYDAIQVPGLVSEDAGERFMAEQRVRMMHTFPDFKIDAEEGLSGRKGKNKKQKGKKKGASGGGGKGFGS